MYAYENGNNTINHSLGGPSRGVIIAAYMKGSRRPTLLKKEKLLIMFNNLSGDSKNVGSRFDGSRE